jgi:recombination DNA repair RAD52 pathway protein
MRLSDAQREALQSPIPADVVTQRTQAGQKLDYVEGWWVIDQLNSIVGNGDWGSEVVSLEHVLTVEKEGKATVTYRAIVRLQGPFAPQMGVGFASSTQRSVGDAHEMAGKSAETDALKRAAVKLGRRLGLALYQKADDEGHREHVAGAEEEFVRAIDAARSSDELDAAVQRARLAASRLGAAGAAKVKDAISRARARIDAARAAAE